jgi:hypothetical protein
MVQIYQNTKIYVLIPPSIESGGPEFLHQLLHYLRYKLNLNAFLYSKDKEGRQHIPRQYLNYNNLIADEIEDDDINVLISPEPGELLEIMNKFIKIRKIIWWLSLDNYFYDKYLREHKIISSLLRGINKISQSLFSQSFFEITEFARKEYHDYRIKNDQLVSQATINICSARHIEQSLLKYELINVVYISELLNEEYLKIAWNAKSKQNIIVFNPKKGLKFTRKLVNKASDFKFVPIINLSKEEVANLLKKAKVYIDFGNHPGRDRLPREAAILGCCVITNKRGGARLYDDLAISDEYKFDETDNSIIEIIKTINDCIINYEIRIKDFEIYRKNILDEPKRFLIGLNEVFINV